MTLVAQSRQLHVRNVLAHPLSPLPWALANADGSMQKMNKAALARELKRNVSPAKDIPDPSTCIIDGMSLVQKMNGNNKTFPQVAESVMSLVLHDGSQIHRIDVVFNFYWETSIKHAERCNWGSSTAIPFSTGTLQQCKKFLCSLIKFILEQWKLPKNSEKLHDKSLCVTCEEVCYKMTKNDWVEVTELKSTQEEADTCVLLHALHGGKANKIQLFTNPPVCDNCQH